MVRQDKRIINKQYISIQNVLIQCIMNCMERSLVRFKGLARLCKPTIEQTKPVLVKNMMCKQRSRGQLKQEQQWLKI